MKTGNCGPTTPRTIVSSVRRYVCKCGAGLYCRTLICAAHVPAFIDYHVLPTELLKMLCHPICVGPNLVLGDSLAVGIPTVPSHGRGWSKQLRVITRREMLGSGRRVSH